MVLSVEGKFYLLKPPERANIVRALAWGNGNQSTDMSFGVRQAYGQCGGLHLAGAPVGLTIYF